MTSFQNKRIPTKFLWLFTGFSVAMLLLLTVYFVQQRAHESRVEQFGFELATMAKFNDAEVALGDVLASTRQLQGALAAAVFSSDKTQMQDLVRSYSRETVASPPALEPLSVALLSRDERDPELEQLRQQLVTADGQIAQYNERLQRSFDILATGGSGTHQGIMDRIVHHRQALDNLLETPGANESLLLWLQIKRLASQSLAQRDNIVLDTIRPRAERLLESGVRVSPERASALRGHLDQYTQYLERAVSIYDRIDRSLDALSTTLHQATDGLEAMSLRMAALSRHRQNRAQISNQSLTLVAVALLISAWLWMGLGGFRLVRQFCVGLNRITVGLTGMLANQWGVRTNLRQGDEIGDAAQLLDALAHHLQSMERDWLAEREQLGRSLQRLEGAIARMAELDYSAGDDPPVGPQAAPAEHHCARLRERMQHWLADMKSLIAVAGPQGAQLDRSIAQSETELLGTRKQVAASVRTLKWAWQTESQTADRLKHMEQHCSQILTLLDEMARQRVPDVAKLCKLESVNQQFAGVKDQVGELKQYACKADEFAERTRILALNLSLRDGLNPRGDSLSAAAETSHSGARHPIESAGDTSPLRANELERLTHEQQSQAAGLSELTQQLDEQLEELQHATAFIIAANEQMQNELNGVERKTDRARSLGVALNETVHLTQESFHQNGKLWQQMLTRVKAMQASTRTQSAAAKQQQDLSRALNHCQTSLDALMGQALLEAPVPQQMPVGGGIPTLIPEAGSSAGTAIHNAPARVSVRPWPERRLPLLDVEETSQASAESEDVIEEVTEGAEEAPHFA